MPGAIEGAERVEAKIVFEIADLARDLAAQLALPPAGGDRDVEAGAGAGVGLPVSAAVPRQAQPLTPDP